MEVLFLIIRNEYQYWFFRNYWFLILPLYIIYIMEVFCNSTFRNLWNKEKDVRIYDYVIKMKKRKPVTILWCNCFHFEKEYKKNVFT